MLSFMQGSCLRLAMAKIDIGGQVHMAAHGCKWPCSNCLVYTMLSFMPEAGNGSNLYWNRIGALLSFVISIRCQDRLSSYLSTCLF